MEPQKYSDGNKVLKYPNLDACAEAWIRYQETPSVIQNITTYLYKLLRYPQQNFRPQRDQAPYHYDEATVDEAGYEDSVEVESESLSSLKDKNYSDFELDSNEFPNQSTLWATKFEDIHNVSNPSLLLSQESIDMELPYQLEALSEEWQLYLAIIYTLTAIASFILNIITVIVLWRCKRSELKKYLINLSVSDLLMSMFSIRK